MGADHNFLALEVANSLLKQLRSGKADWANARLTANTVRWQSIADWPRPDIAFEDSTTKASLAFEFKPPNQSKREYVTGLGQACTYLNNFEFSGLIVPEKSGDGYNIADYLNNTMNDILNPVSIALFSYGAEPSILTPLRHINIRENPPGKVPRGIGKNKFWAYWRDVSNFDIFSLLKIKYDNRDSTFSDVYRLFWINQACKGKSKNWEGRMRKTKSLKQKSYESEKTNAFLALRHTGLFDSSGAITSPGLQLLHTGNVYGSDSIAFLEMLSYFVLTIGQHLELIFWIDKAQRSISTKDKKRADTLYKAIDNALVGEGIILPRPVNAKKPAFVRDEFKLWNKLGLLENNSNDNYFHKDYGLAFNWRKIFSITDTHSVI